MLRGAGQDVIVIGVEFDSRAGRVERQGGGSPGGARLRALREQAGRTQLWVELEAELGTGYLQRVESGRVAQPVRPTVERVLEALGARYGERREVLELFGYTVSTPLPSDDDVAWAIEVSRRELHDVAFPAYVLDCAHNLIAWNRYVPPLFGINARDPTMGGLARRSLLAPWFEPRSSLARAVAEPEAFLPALVRALRYEMQQFGGEAWYAEVLARLHELPPFREAWAQVEQEPPPASAARALVPVRLIVPPAGKLQFHLSSERFTRDARFRMIYYFPADPATMRWCAALAGDARASPPD
jgi:transcriptional regulator with XRE-family HTH domain